MEHRDAFLFYRSFFEAIHSLPKKDRLGAYEAVCEYALNGTQAELSGTPAAVLLLIKPNLDASRRKADSGRRGGKAAAAHKANEKQSASGPEPMKDEGLGIKDVGLGRTEGESASLAAVIAAYQDKINPAPSQSSLEELKGYVETMGAACCLRAIDEAGNAGIATWNYTRGILRAKAAQGVRCIADWDRLESGREAEKQKKREKNLPPACVRDPNAVNQRAIDDMERMRRMMQQMKQEKQSTAPQGGSGRSTAAARGDEA